MKSNFFFHFRSSRRGDSRDRSPGYRGGGSRRSHSRSPTSRRRSTKRSSRDRERGTRDRYASSPPHSRDRDYRDRPRHSEPERTSSTRRSVPEVANVQVRFDGTDLLKFVMIIKIIQSDKFKMIRYYFSNYFIAVALEQFIICSY